MRIDVRLFGAAAEALGTRVHTLETQGGLTCGELLAILVREGGPVLGRCRVAINRVAAEPRDPVPPGAEVAVLPPVSGGAPGQVHVGPEPVSAQDLLERVADPSCGAQVLFMGTVRASTDGWQTRGLDYEAYASMAESVLEDIAQRADALWPGCRLAMAHRVGILAPGQAAVGVAAASSHRGDAFAAARFCIERLKQELPVWKKELGVDGRTFWADHP